MLKTTKRFAGDFFRGGQGIYQNFTERYLPIPVNITPTVIGKTVEGREIQVFRFGKKSDTKILFMGGMHGNEVGTVKLMHKIAKHLSSTSEDLGAEFFVLPCLNLDGMAKALQSPSYFSGGGKGRLNANNVDLNRNFDTDSFETENRWFFGNRHVSVNCGEKPFSEPETKALSTFIEDHGINVFFSFHSRGREVIANDNKLSKKLAEQFSKSTSYHNLTKEEWLTLGQTGTPREWCNAKDIAYVEIESSTRYGSDWKNQKHAILDILNYQNG